MANKLLVGFGRCNITPAMGIQIYGYYKERIADGVLDELEVNAIAFSDGNKKAVMVSIDHCGIRRDVMEEYKDEIVKQTGLDRDAIYLHATHTHTAPQIFSDAMTNDKRVLDYKEFVKLKVVDACAFALNDLKPAKMGFGTAKAENVAFIRRFRMKDGSVKTNPGVNNPDIVAPIGEMDVNVCVLRFSREDGDIVLANFANHPDTVGGNKISGDWPTLFRHVTEKALINTKSIFFNGAQGDVNHVNVHPKGGDFNDMFNDFDGCSRGYGHTRYIARVMAGAVLQIFDKVEYVDVEDIDYLQKEYQIPTNKATTKEELALAHKYNDLHNAGRDDEIPFKEMMLTTVVAEAARMVRLENAPDTNPLIFSALKIGPVGFFGIPGEPFNVVGREVKKTKGYKMVIPTGLTNGYEGYYPAMDAYLEGGYEARSSNFKAGVAERIIEIGKEMLAELK